MSSLRAVRAHDRRRPGGGALEVSADEPTADLLLAEKEYLDYLATLAALGA